jgi:hypothetical protein
MFNSFAMEALIDAFVTTEGCDWIDCWTDCWSNYKLCDENTLNVPTNGGHIACPSDCCLVS